MPVLIAQATMHPRLPAQPATLAVPAIRAAPVTPAVRVIPAIPAADLDRGYIQPAMIVIFSLREQPNSSSRFFQRELLIAVYLMSILSDNLLPLPTMPTATQTHKP
jgi:hypothetical protein